MTPDLLNPPRADPNSGRLTSEAPKKIGELKKRIINYLDRDNSVFIYNNNNKSKANDRHCNWIFQPKKKEKWRKKNIQKLTFQVNFLDHLTL